MARPIFAVTMPKWGIEMTEGTITDWRVREGERVERGNEILDVETEKIVNAVEAPASGVLRRILAAVGDTRAVGELIGIIADERTSDEEIAAFSESFVAAVVSFEPAEDAAPAPAPTAAVAASATPGPAAQESEEARVSPIARRLAERLGVDLSQVPGTGRNGRISKEDVEGFAARLRPAQGAAAPTPAAESPTPAAEVPAVPASAARRVRMSARRKTIARRLQESKQTIPHFRLDIDVDFAPLLECKRERTASAGVRATVNDYLLRAAALTLVEHQTVNAQTDGDDILEFEHADIAIAVAAEAGLVTPILRGADTKSVAQIAGESRDLIERARRGMLQREEITGGSFTISNLGMLGVARFDAIINAPQVAILAVGAVEKRAVVRADAVSITDMATLTLSADHRVVDGAVGAGFLRALRDRLQDPGAL